MEHEESHGVVGDADLFLLDDMAHFVDDVGLFLFRDFYDMQPRLQTFDDFLDIPAHADEVDIVAVLVDVVAENVLALFVDPVDIVDDDHFFLAEEGRVGLAEYFHFVAKVLDSLFLEVVDEEDVFFRDFVVCGRGGGGGGQLVVFVDDGVEESGFPDMRIADKEDIQVFGFAQRFQYGQERRVRAHISDVDWLVLEMKQTMVATFLFFFGSRTRLRFGRRCRRDHLSI